MHVIGYTRVSTGGQDLGVNAQRARIQQAADLEGWSMTFMHDTASGGKRPSLRPGLSEALQLLKIGQAQMLVVAKLDRVARSMQDVAILLEQAKAEGWQLVALDLNIDTRTAEGTMMIHIMAAMAQWERARISERTKEALQVARTRGTRLGRPESYSDDIAIAACKMRSEGLQLSHIATSFFEQGIRTSKGRKLARTQLTKLINRGNALLA